MELVIIALIAVEVVIVRYILLLYFTSIIPLTPSQALIRDGPELWQMLVGSEEEKAHKEELA